MIPHPSIPCFCHVPRRPLFATRDRTRGRCANVRRCRKSSLSCFCPFLRCTPCFCPAPRLHIFHALEGEPTILHLGAGEWTFGVVGNQSCRVCVLLQPSALFLLSGAVENASRVPRPDSTQGNRAADPNEGQLTAPSRRFSRTGKARQTRSRAGQS